MWRWVYRSARAGVRDGDTAPAEDFATRRPTETFGLPLQRAIGSGTVQRKTADPPSSETMIEVSPSRSAGAALDEATRRTMETRVGGEFDDVRVHTDGAAADAARALGADAYTRGRDIYFAAGKYAPSSASGRGLLAHELTHVLQQRSTSFDTAEAGAKLSNPNDPAELQAERVAEASGHDSGVTHEAPETAASGIQRKKASGLEMWQERPDPDEEAQRREAFNIVRDNRTHITAEAMNFNVAPEAIAGAIFWEALENPYHRSFSRLGPGKVHVTETFGKSEAEKVEEEGRIAPVPKDAEERSTRLHDPKTAITYIAAIMRRHADNYLKIAGVDISRNVGVLCTLYQGGNSEARAQRLADRRKLDPRAEPQAGDEMGPWVEANIATIRGWVDPPPRPH
jgi:hypothetical protein